MTKKEKSVRTYTSQQRRKKTRNASAVSVSVLVLVLQSNRPNELLRMIEDFMETKSDWFRFSQKMVFYILSLHCVYLFQSWTSHFSTLSAQTSSDPNSKKRVFIFQSKMHKNLPLTFFFLTSSCNNSTKNCFLSKKQT